MKPCFLFLVLCGLFVALQAQAHEATPVVNSTVGPVFGYVNEFDTYTFRGIPYAKPPVGNLRFAPTEYVDSWTTPLNASKFQAGCIQDCARDSRMGHLVCPPSISEDCLYLNINTPTLNASANLPVVVFIHGGMFTWGAGGIPLYDASLWSKRENIVFVTINYRLNIFGGLHTAGAVSGNFMLLDQRMSLRWVQENIAAFGGDPSQVTVSGQSAGAESTGIHLVSPGSWKYFSRAAVISDPYGLIPATKTMAADLGYAVLEKLSCVRFEPEDELACLRNLTWKEVHAAAKVEYLPTPNEVLSLFMQWSPFIDGEIIPMQPIEAVKQGQMNPVPVYIGTVANETVVFLVEGQKPADYQSYRFLMDYIWGSKASQIEKLFSPMNPKYYDNNTLLQLSKIMTDAIFYCPTMYVAEHASKWNGNQTYTYFFDEHPSWTTWYANGDSEAPCAEYICHAFDLPALFDSFYEIPKSLKMPPPTPAEQNMSKWEQGVWGQFARGEPITGWPTYEEGQLMTYNISLGGPSPKKILDNFRGRYCEFFDSLGYNWR